MMQRLAAAMVAALVCAGTPLAVAGQAPADGRTPVLIELFTSEGCSSCPPADQLLSELIATQPVPGVRIIALSEHVDYWDRLGWKDPFSAPQFSERQSAYAATAGSADVYTPQLVVDGQDTLVGSDRAKALAAIRAASRRPKASIRLAWVSQEPAGLNVEIGEDGAPSRSRVLLAITEDGLTTSVRRGENQGRELAHDAVTRRLTPIGYTGPRGAFQRAVPIGIDRSWRRSALHVVVFVQNGAGAVVALGAIGM